MMKNIEMITDHITVLTINSNNNNNLNNSFKLKVWEHCFKSQQKMLS